MRSNIITGPIDIIKFDGQLVYTVEFGEETGSNNFKGHWWIKFGHKIKVESYDAWEAFVGYTTPINNPDQSLDIYNIGFHKTELDKLPTAKGTIRKANDNYSEIQDEFGIRLGDGKSVITGKGAITSMSGAPQNLILTKNNVYIDLQFEERVKKEALKIVKKQRRFEQLRDRLLNRLGAVYHKLSIDDDIIENQQTTVTNGLFTNNVSSLSTMFTSSLQTTSSKQYYYEAWNSNPATSVTAEAQFSVAYGHRLGSGSAALGTLNDSPARAVYSQYKLLLLEPGDNSFTFKDGTSSDSIYAINFNRARVKEKLDPGNWQIVLGQLSGSTVANNSHTGSSVKINTLTPSFISLIDDSNDYENINNPGGANGSVYNVVSGSLANGPHNPSAPHYYGLVYPDMGIIVLNDNVLNKSCSFNSVTGSNVAGDNAWKLLTSISGAMSANSSANAMQARNVETVSSTHYFVRIRNGEYNYTNNPTFVTGSEGEIANITFKLDEPVTYITTVGLYNDRQELLAVAKLSQPIQKSFAIETLIKVKLDY